MLSKAHIYLIFFFSFTGMNQANALTYTEKTGGDINNNAFNLTIGVNTITGTSSLAYPFESDLDNYIFTIPEGSKIEDVKYDYSVFSNDGGRTYSFNVIQLQEYVHNIIDDIGDNKVYADLLDGSFVKIDLDYLSFVDTYRWNSYYQSALGESGDVFWDYTTTITVSSVPLPASGLLFFSSLFSFFAASKVTSRRRNRHSKQQNPNATKYTLPV